MRLPKRHHGFALLLALATFALVAAAIVALAGSASRQGRREIEKSQNAQLEQILLAGLADAQEHINAHAPAKAQAWDVELPDALTRQAGSLHVVVVASEPDRVTLSMQARLADRSLSQLAQYGRSDNRWALRSVTLD